MRTACQSLSAKKKKIRHLRESSSVSDVAAVAEYHPLPGVGSPGVDGNETLLVFAAASFDASAGREGGMDICKDVCD